jgi:RNA polymerase sigma-70 factor (ECF subfamily)
VSGSVIDLTRPSDRSPSRLPHAGFDLAAEYDAHSRVLFAFAVNALRDRGQAEDCVQETFLRAWRARERFDPSRAAARTWLFAILRNVIVDAQRTMQRMPRTVNADAGYEPAAPPDDTLQRLLIVEGLAKLSEEHRRALVAIHIDGDSYAEVSARSGVPVATLRTRVYYALRALRGHIDFEEDRND